MASSPHISTSSAAVENWYESSYSKANGCVEVGSGRSTIGVRDSKLGRRGPVFGVSPAAWTAFTTALRGGRFE
ncbi:protein of unknown function [Actinopolyspora alba]|uniref:DUF397 domain-containing protein n=1 Tax=Actinopolyspora alba TaxID=673379 RepID=A0A1I1WWQ1_9ACTN|nr:DUF397 domain-containing protein [Actinopolyspora alba]SFD97883.1 protein of unknown function [Actinopolyspora alba]